MSINTKDRLIELIKQDIDNPPKVIFHAYQVYVYATDEELGPELAFERKAHGLCIFLQNLLKLETTYALPTRAKVNCYHDRMLPQLPGCNSTHIFGRQEYFARASKLTQDLDPLRLAWVHHVLIGGSAADFKVPDNIDMKARV